MTVSLYRKYRPQTFAEVVGQNHIKVALENEIKRGQVAHAYLFAGPRGIGKTTSARLIAKAVNCEKRQEGEAEPCNSCSACAEITAGRSLDVIEIDAASHTGVDNVRENIIDNARFTPNKLRYKVFIIDEVHMLSLSAFNALLKILEEPPAHILFILCTTELHKIPVTIISRCQRFDFRKVVFEDLVSHLTFICKQEGVQCDKAVVQAVARRSEGYLRDAVGLLGQILSLGEKKISLEQAELVIPRSNFAAVIDLIYHLTQHDSERALQLISRLVDEGVDLQRFTLEMVECLRQLLLIKISGTIGDLTTATEADQQQKVEQIVKAVAVPQLVVMIEQLIRRSHEIMSSVIQQLPLELAAVELCGSAPSPEPFAAAAPRSSDSAGSAPRPVQSTTNTAPASKPTVTPAKTTKGAVKLSSVQDKWVEVINALIDNNHSLALTLRVGSPMAVAANVVTIGFKYKFHQEMMSEHKNRLTLTKALSSILGTELDVDLVVSDALELNRPAAAPAESSGAVDGVTDVAEMFSGKVVG
ncbi:DNA polymerase III subunit gamma/tau [Candidatus Falkowbacteria bacterium]|nr:DNA polymerase III subunit gamma/tau [Candidatus Falkowbacteria bacterium]